MKLADCIQRINQTLNYPAFSYPDVSHFLDQAVVELNTTLRVSVPLVSEMLEQSRTSYLDSPDAFVLNSVPNTSIPTGTTQPTDSEYWYNTSDGKFYINGFATPHDVLYGVYMPNFSERRVFQSAVYSNSMVIWIELDINALPEVELSNWLPDEWVILFVIPYVCSKCSARDGGNSALYVEEYTQGFQQLLTAYQVPNKVYLPSVAHLPAYSKDVSKLLDANASLNVHVSTKAIYSDMKINTAERAIFGGMYENGGWGL